MTRLLSLSLSTAVFSFIWAAIAIHFTLPGWIGFLGCTAYFALPEKSGKQIPFALVTVLSGVFWAVAYLAMQNLFSGSTLSGALFTGLVAFVICYQARTRILTYIPGAFIGASSTIASEGEWKLVSLLLISGVSLGYLMERCGGLLEALTRKEQA